MEVRCPACKKVLSSPKAVPKHVNGCPQWDAVIGVSPSVYNFDQYFRRGLYALGLEEGRDYVVCAICAFRSKRLKQHIEGVHGQDEATYIAAHPGAQMRLESTSKRRKVTTRALYGVDNVFQAEEVKAKSKETLLARYGVGHPMKDQRIRAKAALTNLERYGSEELFASPIIQERLRGVMVERHGAPNPQQVPVIRAATQATNLARYGNEMFLQSQEWMEVLKERRLEREADRRLRLITSGTYEICPHCDEIFTAVTSTHKAICEGWPDAEDPEPCLCGHEANSFTTMKRHRVQCVAWQTRDADAVMRMRTVRTMLDRHGASSVLESPSLIEKVIRTCLAQVGVTFDEYAEPALSFEDLMERYGLCHPMKHREYAAKHLQSMANCVGPNGLEKKVYAMASDRILFTGDRVFWRWLPALRRHKNPDFIVPGPNPTHPYRDVQKVIEAFGDFWHGKSLTGKDPEEHESELIEAYAEVGIDCLVLWESEVKGDWEGCKGRVQEWLG